MTNKTDMSLFPRGSDVPFPLERPYPQQVHLMDAILQSLQAHQKQNASTDRHRALVMMLESPTGTGKSLSLACAAMTWLRHMEEQDSIPCDQKKEEEEVVKKGSDTVTSPKAATTDWWNAWVPLEEREEQHHQQQALKTALETREALHKELHFIRQQLNGITSSTTTKANTDASTDLSLLQKNIIKAGSKGEIHKHHNHRERRENLVRSAVTTAKMMEKRQQRTNNKRAKPPKRSQQQQQHFKDETIDYCVDDYHSDDDDETGNESNSHNYSDQHDQDESRLETCLEGAYLDGSVRTVNRRMTSTYNNSATAMGSVQPGTGVRKIFYAARTHSQLSQMVRELQRTAWGSNVRVVALGGRQFLCHNPQVNHKGRSETAIAEACLDLQKKKQHQPEESNHPTTTDGESNLNGQVTQKKRKSNSRSTTTTGSGCHYLASRNAISTLAMHLLSQPSDIEDAARLGTASQTCAYYATRKSLAAAEVVVLPYNMLLSQQAREAVGLSLKGSLIIIDEAHNLPEALRALHSSKVSLPVAEAALAQLIAYTERYASRLAGRNLYYLGQLRRILLGMNQYLKQERPASNGNNHRNHSAMMSPEELLLELKLDHINLFKVLRYLKNSRLSQKLLGFVRQTTAAAATTMAAGDVDHNVNKNVDTRLVSQHVSAMAPVQSFLEKLVMTSSEGKVVTDWPSSNNNNKNDQSPHHGGGVAFPTLRYVLLQPAAHFDHILQEAHAVALVGGTLRPFAHMAAELLSNESDIDLLVEAKEADDQLQKQQQASSTLSVSSRQASSSSCSTTFVAPRWTAFTCDHVVPPSHVHLECLGYGPTHNVPLDFRHASRTADETCDELARVLIQTCQVVPAGVVVFVPSYSYEATLVRRWKLTGSWKELSQHKRLHREPKSSQQVEETLANYAKDAQTKGALLLSVIGGKMSEGINFSDDMARCVVVVGLPYPDRTDPVLQEKMNLMDRHQQQKQPQKYHGGGSATNTSTTTMITGQAYYQNLCLRAINQSVGRAIRHANDYAAILLCDVRYTIDERIWSGLPLWLRRSAAAAAAAAARGNSHLHRTTEQKSFAASMNRLKVFFQDKQT